MLAWGRGCRNGTTQADSAYAGPIDRSPTDRFARFVGSRRASIFELVFLVAFAIGLALAVQSWAVKPFQIPSESMEPTLNPGQRVLVNRFSTHLGADPQVGDVVVFRPPVNAVASEGSLPKCEAPAARYSLEQVCPVPGSQEAGEDFIKRVVAGPGDRLKVIAGIPIVNGHAVEGDWETVPCEGAGSCDYSRPITIPRDHYFMMGDNRPASDDSRFWGPVPRAWIVGKAFATYWPPRRIGSL